MRTGARRTHRDAAPGERGTHRLVAWVAALALLSWEKAWLVPYAHGIRYYVALQRMRSRRSTSGCCNRPRGDDARVRGAGVDRVRDAAGEGLRRLWHDARPIICSGHPMAQAKAVTVAAFDVAATTQDPLGVLLQLYARGPEGMRPVPTMFIDREQALKLVDALQRALQRN